MGTESERPKHPRANARRPGHQEPPNPRFPPLALLSVNTELAFETAGIARAGHIECQYWPNIARPYRE